MIIIKCGILYYYRIYVCCCPDKCEDVHCSFNFSFLNPICEITRNKTLLIFVYVLVNLYESCPGTYLGSCWDEVLARYLDLVGVVRTLLQIYNIEKG